jgi:hypothetical protein
LLHGSTIVIIAAAASHRRPRSAALDHAQPGLCGQRMRGGTIARERGRVDG